MKQFTAVEKYRATVIILGLITIGLIVWFIVKYNGDEAALQGANTDLIEQITALQKTGASLTNQIRVLQSTNTALASQITTLQGANTDLIEQITALQKTGASLTNQIRVLQSTNTALADQIAALQKAAETDTVTPATTLVVSSIPNPVKGTVPVILINQGNAEASVTFAGKRGDFAQKVAAKNSATIMVPPGQYNWSGPNNTGTVSVDDVPTHRYPGEDGSFAGRIIVR